MRCRPTFRIIEFFVMVLCLIFAGKAFCQDTFEKQIANKVDSLLAVDKTDVMLGRLFPNDAIQTITIPSGWGGYGTYIFGSVGGVYPQVYHTNTDLIASGGFCVGNPVKDVNFAASLNLADVHKFQDFSVNLILSRVVASGSSISAGGLQLLAGRKSDAPNSTFYFAFSHAVQSMPSDTKESSKLTYTIGVGSGRFYFKSPDDVGAGRGKYGTAVFGGVSYEIVQHVNLIGEWSGMNLGLSAGIRPFKNPLSIGLGYTNITRYSADKSNIVFTFGYPLSLTRRGD
jgi:hypothetical protein